MISCAGTLLFIYTDYVKGSVFTLWYFPIVLAQMTHFIMIPDSETLPVLGAGGKDSERLT